MTDEKLRSHCSNLPPSFSLAEKMLTTSIDIFLLPLLLLCSCTALANSTIHSPSGSVWSPGPSGTCGLENCGAACPQPPYPDLPHLPVVPKLNDPFTYTNGTKVATKDDWICRRAEINDMFQHYELGPKPNAPPQLSGSVSRQAITVTTGDGTRSISWTAPVTLPPTGRAPYPILIGMGGANINVQAVQNLGVAYINFNNSDIAQQNSAASRGLGKFYDLYGHDHPAGAMSAWAWAISRMIDVMERDTSGLFDVRHIAISGCSRNGKGTLVATALDERVALAIPQESGSGGAASWRISDWQGAPTVQTLAEITGENVWFTESLAQFGKNVTNLPFDHHLLMGMVAPRGLLVIENTGVIWGGNISCWGDSLTAREIYKALSIDDRIGMSQIGGHPHCQFPASQEVYVEAYIHRFLFDDTSANTTIFSTDGGYVFNTTQWIDWPTPILT